MRWAFLFFFLLSACTPNSAQMALKPVIQVNDRSMTVKDFAERLARSLRKYDALSAKDPNNVQRAKDEILRVFVLRCLASTYARASDISIGNDELDKEINSIRSSYPDDVSFRRTLAEEGLSLADWKEELRSTLLERKVFKKIAEKVQKPAPEETRKYFEANKDRYKHKERVFLRQIVVDEFSKAQALRDELKKKDFSDLAKKFSVAPEGKSGGLVGWIERGSVDIFDKAFSLPVGGLSPVLESAYGFHIFKVERKSPAGTSSLDEVRPLIEQELMGQREQGEFANWLDKQIRASRVLRDNALIKSLTVETRGEK